MKNRAKHTLKSLLEELKINYPSFEEGQIFEILKSIYPDSSINKENKIIFLNSKEFTKPLAVSRRDKAVMLKEGNEMLSFFRNTTKGDFIKIVEVKDEKAKCVNLSLKESIKEKYYKDKDTKYINISFDDIANGNLKLIKRKIDKYLE